MKDLTQKEQICLASDIETGQLVKSKNFLFTNLSKRMSFAQNTLFSLALLHAEVDEDGYATATFTKSEVERYLDLVDYKKGRSTRVIEDIEQVGTNSILMFDEQMITDPQNGKLKGVLIFAQYTYNQGIYHFVFNTTKIKYQNEYITPILDILRKSEVNPVVYNLDIFSKLNASGQVLYEQILLATENGKRELVFDLEGLRGLFGITGASMQIFGNIKAKHLVPAIEKINKFADIGVVYKPIKASRKITGVKIYWTVDKIKIPATEKQINLAYELYTELKLLKAENVEQLKLQQITKYTKTEAQEIIDNAIRRKKEVINKALEAEESFDELKQAVGNKRSKEAASSPAQDESKEDFASSDVEADISYLDIFFNKYPSISEKNRERFIEVSKAFEKAEVLSIFELADDIKKANKGRSFTYTLKILEDWKDSGRKTLAEAKAHYNENYNHEPQLSPKAPKQRKSNVPEWSNPNYQNTTTEEEKADMAKRKEQLLASMDKVKKADAEPKL